MVCDSLRSVSSKLQKIFKHTKADALLLYNSKTQDSNFTYLTGFTSGIFENTFMIATRKKLILLSNKLEYGIAQRERPKEMTVVKVKAFSDLTREFKRYLYGKEVGINEKFLPYSHYRAIKKHAKPKRILDASEGLASARGVKDESELQKMKKANMITKKMLKQMPKFFKEGMTEKELAANVEYIMRRLGAQGPSFPTIVCFAANSALPHHMPENAKLRKNSFVLIDCGARYDNYCADVTRTFIFKPEKRSGKYKKMVEIYNTVKEAQHIGISSVKAGVTGKTVHNKVSRFIDTAKSGKYKGKFIHSLGHPIGIEVHDVGVGLNQIEDRKLQENMVVSVEPGIYIPGFGGVRIEDGVLVTKKGAKVL